MSTRREFLATLATMPALRGQTPDPPIELVRAFDANMESVLRQQITDPAHRRRGSLPDPQGLFWPGTGANLINNFAVGFLVPTSRFYRQPLMLERLRLAHDFLRRHQSADGNIDNPITNWNSTPDTAFAARPVASAVLLAQRRGVPEIGATVRPFLVDAGRALVNGGIHTPNHRWVLCATLAVMNEVMPNPAYLARIDQWLAEGIDIDTDGQFTERSTYTYNPIVDTSFVILADKLKRPALLDPVRRNLDSLTYLIHPNGDVVTEISRRQDQYQKGSVNPYWFAAQYLAVKEGNPRYAALAELGRQGRSLGYVLEYPFLLQRVAAEPLPDDYERVFPAIGIARLRRKATSATILLNGNSRLMTLRRGAAVIQAVRMSSSFFGKGQFVPQSGGKQGSGYVLTQDLSAGYYQPLQPPHHVGTEDWDKVRPERRETERCVMRYVATVKEERNGLSMRLQATGTNDVPVTVEINCGEGTLSSAERLPGADGAWLAGATGAELRAGEDAIRISGGPREHRYVQVRGAEPKLPGNSLYFTGLTPFDHTLRFEWS